jgi:hypothetical protein
MAWLAVNKDGQELIFEDQPQRNSESFWFVDAGIFNSRDCVGLPKGTIKKILGYSMKWEDEPIEIT